MFFIKNILHKCDKMLTLTLAMELHKFLFFCVFFHFFFKIIKTYSVEVFLNGILKKQGKKRNNFFTV